MNALQALSALSLNLKRDVFGMTFYYWLAPAEYQV